MEDRQGIHRFLSRRRVQAEHGTFPPGIDRMAYFVVNQFHGPAWVEGRPMREQDGWPEHRDFMNALPEGFVFLGGPVDGHRRAMLLVKAADLSEVRRNLDPDPWVRSGHLVEVVEPWEILIGTPP